MRGDRRAIEEAVRLVVGAEQRLDPRLKPASPPQAPVQVGGSGHRVGHLACGGEDVSFAHDQPPEPEGVSLPNAREAVRITQRNRRILFDGRVQPSSRRAVTSQARA